jgi:tagatose-6-phosphate ketose/aldose isomerase
MSSTLLADMGWLEKLAPSYPRLAEIFSRSPGEQRNAGYFNTLREIFQQPATWIRTAEQMSGASAQLQEWARGVQTLVLTGSGSSEFAGECVLPSVTRELGVVGQVIGGGTLLTYGSAALPAGRPALVVSLARSGDSPESAGTISRLLAERGDVRHLVLTCNREGRMANAYREDKDVRVITLDDATNDRSLVMTSSFTNLALAARALGAMTPEKYRSMSAQLSSIAGEMLRRHVGPISSVSEAGFRRAVFLGSGSRVGAARESALKMLEMTAGAVATMAESYLGFRHGPMSFAHQDTIIVCFLSSDPVLRAYECDLVQELSDKELGLLKVIVGDDVPAGLARANDVVIDCPGLAQIADDDSAIIHVIGGQLLAFFRCLEQGLRPDSPSEAGVINRVVQDFKLYVRENGKVMESVTHGRNLD